MKRFLIVIAALGASACTNIELPDNIKASRLIAVCRDGTNVVRSNVDGRLRTVKHYDGANMYGYLINQVEDGLTAKDVCR